ncbi:Type II secretion system F domain [Ignisphaera aggregans DSM 17230]|uniref:Type II secretion system F domain n=1 Tax=Ignisphaera aggregans (strain DSM 17230 / JCM 13409 / AQ1.S1) TaxID=583356 RepID=E0SRT0_IGNAA|nr:Type II secretion system F domain [Ignisphaera aggregans DSM 17230]
MREKLSDALYISLKPFEFLIYSIYRYIDPKLEIYVIGSGISPSINRYVYISSLAMLVSLIAVFIISSIYTIYVFGIAIPIAITASAILSIATIFLVLAMVIAIPRIMYSNRSRILESKAILLLMAISLLSASGLDIYSVFERIPNILGESYKYFSIEIDRARYMVRAGIPIDKVFSDIARITPSQILRELFSGLSSFSRVGGDLGKVVEGVLTRYISRYELEVERIANTLSVYTEIYVAISLLIPVLIGSLAMIFLIYPIGGISFEAIMFLSTFILIPVSSLVIAVLADVAVSRFRP